MTSRTESWDGREIPADSDPYSTPFYGYCPIRLHVAFLQPIAHAGTYNPLPIINLPPMHRPLLLLLLACLALSSRLVPRPTPRRSTLTYSPSLSQKYAAYASVAFCPRSCVQSWSCGNTAPYPRLVNVTYIQNNVTKAVGYIGYDPTTQSIITSWRGSSNTQNWIEDFNFEMQVYGACQGCYVHVGFMADYKLSEKRLLAAAQAIVKFYKVERILCTGHSLGAALAMINGVEFAQKFPDVPVEVHNFGCPRLGNKKLAQFIKTKVETVYRVVHNKDLVPHLPPDVEYHHPGQQVFFNEDMTSYKICAEGGEDSTCSNKFFPNYDPNDHDFYFIHISATKC